MALNKKGIVFSLIAIGLSGLFIVYFSSYYVQPIDSHMPRTVTKIRTLDSSIDDFYDFAEEALSASGFGALEALYLEINKTSGPQYLLDFEGDFLGCTQNGILVNLSTCKNDFKYEKLLENYSNRLKDHLFIDFQPQLEYLRLVEEDHFSFTLEANISFVLNDEFASWSGHRVIQRKVETSGVQDPAFIYIYSTYGDPFTSVERRIRPNYVQDIAWDFEKFRDFVHNREYRASTKGPCLRHRYMGLFDETDPNCGLETVVDPIHIPIVINAPHWNMTSMDYDILHGDHYPCDGDGPKRVTILNVTSQRLYDRYNILLQLTVEDATRFNLEDNWYWADELNTTTTAPGCEGCVLSDCWVYGP